MIAQILTGTLMIVVTTAFGALIIACSESLAARWFSRQRKRDNAFVIKSVMSSTLTFVVALTVMVWLWALLFWGLSIFPELEPSLYFSLVAFTTLGFGDVILPNEWRLLAGFIAANGFILFGLGTAYMMETLQLSDLRIKGDSI